MKGELDMGTLVVSENVSLDGVVEDPAGDEGFKFGGWVGLIRDRPAIARITLDEALQSEALLLGRRTYEWFASRWPSRNGELADRLNGLPKFVVSSTLERPSWNNSTLLRGDPAIEVATLKSRVGGQILLAGSFQLLASLLAHDQVDELRLRIYPVVLGEGKRLFAQTGHVHEMRLMDVQMIDDGVAVLTYRPERGA